MSKNTITLDNFADWHGQLNGVELRSHMPLPEYAPTTDINIDLGRIVTMAQIGRLESVRFGLYDEDQQTSFGISGVDRHGAATATAIKSKAATRSRGLVQNPNRPFMSLPKGQAFVRVNASHSDLDNQNLRAAEPWAKLLDKGIKDGLKQASRKQLFSPKAERRGMFSAYKSAQVAMAGMIGTTAGFEGLAVFTSIFAAADASGAVAWFFRRGGIRGTNGYDVESSVCMYLPVDRYFATQALAKTQKIVKAK